MKDSLEEKEIHISIEGVPPNLASSFAEELKKALLDANVNLNVERVRSEKNAQDLGATLILLLGAPAVVAAVNAISAWAAARQKVKLVITLPDSSKIELENVTEKTAKETLHLALKHSVNADGS